MTMEQPARLSPEQFKAVLVGKGWTFTKVAKRWGITPEWMSKIAGNPRRASHYDDAVMGLPSFQYLTRNSRRRLARVDAFVADVAGRPRTTTGVNRYSGYLVVGTVMAVSEDVGSIAETGMRGVVFSVRLVKNAEEYGVIFESGGYDWFSSNFIDKFMASTGLTDDGSSGFRYTSEDALEAAFGNRQFNFWP